MKTPRHYYVGRRKQSVRKAVKLHTVNVIEFTSDDLQSVRSFADDVEGNRRAEKLFKRLVKEYEAQGLTHNRDFVLSDKDDIQNYLDEGIFEYGPPFIEYKVLITHSV